MQMHGWIRFGMVLLALLLPVAGQAREIFVGPVGSGNDNSSCGSSGSPCATPRYATNSLMQSGDTVTIRAGTYTSNASQLMPPSGSGEGSRTLVRGDPGVPRTSIILRDANTDNEAITLTSNKSYITFQHFTIDGSYPGSGNPVDDNRQWQTGNAVGDADDHSVHHITVDDLEIRFIRKSGFLVSGNNYRVTNNWFHHVGRNSHFCPLSEADCTLHSDDHGLYWKATSSLIQGNTFYTPTAEWNIQNYSGGSTSSDFNTYDRNTFQGGNGGCVTVTNGSNIIFTNNECYVGAPYTGWYTAAGGATAPNISYPLIAKFFADVPNMQIFNNTFDGSNELYSSGDSNIVWRNNIYCNSSRNFAGGTSDSNFTTSCTGFQNQGAHQYQLTSAATAMINQGANTSPTVTQDRGGNVRTAPYDIGAWEFGSSATAVPTSLQFGQPPTTTPATAAITPAMTVLVMDQNGNPMGTGTQQITLALQTPLPPGGGSLSGTVQRNAVAGTATFDNVSVSAAATGYQLRATATGLTQALSSTFTITAPVRTGPIVVYVAPGALNDSQPCESADITHPRKTLAGGLACLIVPGDTLLLRAGTYNECIDTGVTPIKGGTSESVRTTIGAYSTETVTLTLPPSCQAIAIFQNSSEDHYITLDRLILDVQDTLNSNGLVYYPGSHHIRFQNGVIKNTYYEGVFISNADDTEVINSTIDTSQFYGVNVTGTSTRTLLKGLTIKNHVNAGVQVTNGSVFSLLQSTLTANGTAGLYPAIRVGGSGNTGSSIMNTVVYGNYAGLDITSGASGLKLYHLTVANNTNPGITIANGAINTNLFNSISTGHGGGQNLVNNAGASTVQGGVLQNNPGFTNPGGGDFTLLPTATTAIDQGVALTEVTTDRTGTVTRPQGAGYDIGAYECPAPCTTGPPPTSGVQLTAPAWKSGGLLRR